VSEPGTRYHFAEPFTEDDVRSLMLGAVPEWLRDVCRGFIEFTLETGRVDYVGMREEQQHQAPRTPRRKTRKARGRD
jgi:hypothetical protein